jgi:hypothetical protein
MKKVVVLLLLLAAPVAARAGSTTVTAVPSTGSGQVTYAAGTNGSGNLFSYFGICDFSACANGLAIDSGGRASVQQPLSQVAVGGAAVPTDALVSGGVYNSTLPTLSSGNAAAFQVDSSGRQIISPSNLTTADESAFTQGTSAFSTVGALYEPNGSITNLTAGQAGVLRTDAARYLLTQRGLPTVTLTAWAAGTTSGTVQTLSSGTSAMNAILVQLDQGSGISAGAITFQYSNDGTNWSAFDAYRVIDPTSATGATISIPYTLQASVNKAFLLLVNGYQQVRIEVSTTTAGGSVTPYMTGIPYSIFTAPQVTDLTQVGGAALTLGQTTMSASVPVAIASNQGSIPVTGTFWQTTQPVSSTGVFEVSPTTLANLVSNPFFNSIVIGGALDSITNGIYANLLQGNAVLSSTNPIFSEMSDGTHLATIKAGSTAAVAGDTSQVVQINPNQPNLTTPLNVALAANQSVNVAQINGVTVLAGAGTVGTGSQRVAVGQDTTTIAGSAPGTAGSPSSNVVSVQGVTSGTAIPVSGTFWQTTQPISAASLPLPSGAATSANQAAVQTPVAPATATATAGVLLGGQYNSTQETLTNGQQGQVALSSRGAIEVATGADTFNATINAALPAGSNSIGTVVLGAGSATIGALTANQSVNTAQVAGATTAIAASGVQKVGVVGNAGATVDAAPGSAPTNAVAVQGVASMTPISVSTSDPCTSATKTNVAIATSSGNTQLVAGSSGKKIYICSAHVIAAAAAVINVIEGTGAACTTANEAAIWGSTTAASGESYAANGGMTYGDGVGTVGVTATAANGVCLLQSGTTAIAGNITYVQQ